MPNFEINKEIVFSTGHISEECGEALREASIGVYRDEEAPLTMFTVYEDEYGFRILILPENPSNTNFPELDKILQVAIENECAWVRFDGCGPTYPGFETFDW